MRWRPGYILTVPPTFNVQDFAGRVAIVTGAARGLGRATAERLYERGASVAMNGRDHEHAATVAQSLGDRALAVPGDLAAQAAPEEIVERALGACTRSNV